MQDDIPLYPVTRASVDRLLETAPCGFLSFADDGSVELVNATLLEMLGYQREELVGVHVERILTVATRIFYQTHWFPLLRLHGEADEIFLMLRSKTGEDVGVLVNARRRNAGTAASYDCVLMRVRERQKYEDELLRARRVADQARRKVEIQAQELQQANEQLQAQALELELQQEQLEEHATALEETGAALQASNDKLLARTAEAEQLRAVAEAANKAKSTFLAVMSHELRTPLNAIAGYVQLIEMGIHGPVTDAQLKALDRVSRSQAHLLGLINDVLNLARIEAGRVEYVIEDVPAEEIVAGVTPMIYPQLEEKGLTFSAGVDPQLVIRADREKAQQILLNLLGNAVKFTPAGGRIAVEASRPADGAGTVQLAVRDSGIGIPSDQLDSVFEPFVQVKDGRKRRSEGSGLGLAISRDLARGMGGDLTARSTPGEGSTFTLSLPQA